MDMEDSLMGFGGGTFTFGALSEGGGGGGAAYLGCSGTKSEGRLEADKVEEPLEEIEGGLGGAMCGGCMKEKSSSSSMGWNADGRVGAGRGGGCRLRRSGSPRPYMNSV